MTKRLHSDPVEMISTLWSETFNLPQNDERLLSLTPTEALRQVNARVALANLRSAAAERARDQRDALNGIDEPIKPKVETKTDEAAQRLADTPHLTGDPELDAIELAETDPSRPPLKLR